MSDYATHKKTGNKYRVEHVDITNATNGEHDGERMVLYSNKNGQKFVREYQEFKEKFNMISDEEMI
jgi:hypothetical protein